ncbi:MAG: preprotein translocase YidC, partial [Clostridia bacterium]|nr:preprotein translocase YidC [Clostridia bacterium]
MSIFEMLGTVLLGPLKLVFEVIFSVANGAVNNPGLAIIALSLCMNTLLMPLYKRADAVQLEARDKEAEMKPVSDHIKKTFSGDERMMLLQTHYRQ